MKEIFDWYVRTVGEYPFQAAFIQFAVLGMAGDGIARRLPAKGLAITFFSS